MKKPVTSPHPQAKQKQNLSKPSERYSRARRRLVQSIAASGAAMSVKTIPERWARPILDSTMLPAHAESTPGQAPCVVSCAVSAVTYSASVPVDYIFDGDANIIGFPLVGGQMGTVTQFGLDLPYTFTVSGISAVTSPACTVDLEIDLVETVDTQFTVLSGGDLQSLVNNTASFNAIEVAYAGNDPTGNPTAELDLTFASPGAGTCVIDITFIETPPG